MTPIPLIIDTDPGVDDAVALLLAAASPEVELCAVTTVFGNVELATTTGNALRLMTLAGRPDVPVAAGAARPLVHPQAQRAAEWHGADGLGGHAGELGEPAAGPDPRGAVEVMVDVLRAATRPVTIAAIGPLTNIALLLATHPELAPKIGRIVAMGGALGGGNTTAAAEFNIYSDPEAAHRVLTEPGVAVNLVPLDLTLRCAVSGEWLDGLATAGPRCATLGRVIEGYRGRYRSAYGRDGVALHDAVAVFEAVLPGTLATTRLPLQVACDAGPARGAVIADRRSTSQGAPVGHAVAVAHDVDVAALHEALSSRLSRL